MRLLAGEWLIEELFTRITGQLEAKGLILKRGTVVDAIIMESTGRPLTTEDRKELAEDPPPK